MSNNINPFGYNLIYGWTSDAVEELEGLTKIGMTRVSKSWVKNNPNFLNNNPQVPQNILNESANERIKNDIGYIDYSLEFAIFVNKRTDYNFKKILSQNGINNTEYTVNGHRRKELYEIAPDDAKEYINRWLEGESDLHTNEEQVEPFKDEQFRDEQNRFIDNTVKAYKEKNNEKNKRLWDAKMRFGKTLSTYGFIKKAKIKKTLIITHRPIVNDAWYDDYVKYFSANEDNQYQFATKKLDNKPRAKLFENIDRNNPFIMFVSMQDMRGKQRIDKKQFKKSNEELFGVDWDLIVVDEAHEGNLTTLAHQVHSELKRKFTLFLSGTPFVYLSTGEFDKSEIDEWDYVDEQSAKENWNYGNGDNPYEMLPKLNMQTISVNENDADKYGFDEETGGFNFAEMFRVVGTKARDNYQKEWERIKKEQHDGNEPKDDEFIYKKDINDFLDKISSSVPIGYRSELKIPVMPYSNERKMFTKHSLWLVPGVKQGKALKELLTKHKKFCDFDIINVCGSGDIEKGNALKTIQDSIKKAEKNHKGTITLSCGKATVGVTVPEWTSCLMLANVKSAQKYFQTIFRTQSPYTNLEGGYKEDCFIYDFDPDRCLTVFTEVSNAKGSNEYGKSGRNYLDKLLKYLPVLNYDGTKMQGFDSDSMMREVKKYKVEKVLKNKFDTKLLFTSDISRLKPEIRQILQVISGIAKNSGINNASDAKVIISDEGYDDNTLEEAENANAKKEEKRELTDEEKEKLEIYKKNDKEKKSMLAALRFVSVRIPLMLLAIEPNENLIDNFTIKDFTKSFDDESWNEFWTMGSVTITKKQVQILSPAFDIDTLRGSVKKWLADVDEAISIDENKIDDKLEKVSELFQRIKNYDKEVVITPLEVVKMLYEKSGFEVQLKEYNATPPNVYDINTKSGLFPFYGAYLIKKHYSMWSWEKICEGYVFANARTEAGKLITLRILGFSKNSKFSNNITVVDIIKEKSSGKSDEDVEKLLLNRP